MESSEAVESRIHQEAEKLDRFYKRITSCRVVVEVPHRHHKWGVTYHITIEIGVPGEEIVVKHEPKARGSLQSAEAKESHKQTETNLVHKDIYVAIADAFNAARRRLQDYARRQRGDVKVHIGLP